MTASPLPRLELRLPRAELSRFKILLQRGVALQVPSGASAHTLLTEELGVPADYVRERITTVFLDGQVVDNLETAMLRESSLLALSAAMPGLVGATLRKSGYYAKMRAAITRGSEPGSTRPAALGPRQTVRVKLFNLLIEELGPAVLAYGVVLDRNEATEALQEQELPPGEGLIELRVQFDE